MALFIGELQITGFEIIGIFQQNNPVQYFIYTRRECNSSIIVTIANRDIQPALAWWDINQINRKNFFKQKLMAI